MGNRGKSSADYLSVFVIIIMGIANTLWLSHKIAFEWEYFPERYAKYIWTSFENASVNFQKIALFVFLVAMFGTVYILYASEECIGKAILFTIITVMATLIIGKGFWKVLLFIMFFSELMILGVADLICGVLRMVNLGGLNAFIMGALQVIMVLVTFFLSVSMCYKPFETLSETSSRSSSNQGTTSRGSSILDKDYFEEARKDRILETLKDIDHDLKNMK